MFGEELLEYIADIYEVDDILNILNKDKLWLLNKIKEDLLEHKDDFLSGDEYYTEIIE